jgi:hypothetical protein
MKSAKRKYSPCPATLHFKYYFNFVESTFSAYYALLFFAAFSSTTT